MERIRWGRPRGLLAALVAVGLPACGDGAGADSVVPDPPAARRAVERAMRAWAASPAIERTVTAIRPVMFVEQQQPPGQKLLDFEVLGETPGYEDQGYRRVMVRLTLAEPDEAVVAVYYVFGRGPVWVYRAEDFDMIMHMDKSMMPPPAG